MPDAPSLRTAWSPLARVAVILGVLIAAVTLLGYFSLSPS